MSNDRCESHSGGSENDLLHGKKIPFVLTSEEMKTLGVVPGETWHVWKRSAESVTQLRFDSDGGFMEWRCLELVESGWGYEFEPSRQGRLLEVLSERFDWRNNDDDELGPESHIICSGWYPIVVPLTPAATKALESCFSGRGLVTASGQSTDG